MRTQRGLKFLHFVAAAIAFLIVMALGGAVVVTARLIDLLPWPDPLPFLVWSLGWFLALLFGAWFIDRRWD